MFIDQLEPADRRNISLLLDNVMSNRDPRTKFGPSRTRTKTTENLKPIRTDWFMGSGSAFLTSSIFPFQPMTRFQTDFRHNFGTLDFENIHPKMAVTKE